ncbi:MAG: tol-pal system-associated acyl-CoA thioesterase [Candidatus Velthaea sp.]
MKSDDRIVIRDRVRWSDVDKMNVMLFAKYLRFVEIAETEFFRALGYSYDEIAERLGVWIARIHLDMDFRAPARLDEELVCWAELGKLGGSSMNFAFPIERASDGKRLCDVQFVLACLDRTTLKSTRIPAPLAGALRARVTTAA